GQVRFGETRGSSIVLHTWLRHPFRTDESSRCLSEFQSVACTRRRGTRREEICKEGRLGSFHGTRWSGSRPRVTSFIAGVELKRIRSLRVFRRIVAISGRSRTDIRATRGNKGGGGVGPARLPSVQFAAGSGAE